MHRENKVNVLLCSPYGRKVGGIQRWTGHVLEYNKSIITGVEIKQLFPERPSFNNTSRFMRFYVGIYRYFPFIRNFKSELNNNTYNLAHFVSSGHHGLIRDLFLIKVAHKRKVKTLIHFRFGRIPHLYQNPNWEQKLLHRVISLADKVVVIDKASYNTLIEKGYTNIELLPNPLTPAVSKIISKNKEIERDRKSVV